MKVLLNTSRLKNIIADVKTESDLSRSLRRHGIRYTWTTEPGYLAAKIPLRSGAVYVYRTASRSAPFALRSAAPAPSVYPFPLPRWTWDD